MNYKVLRNLTVILIYLKAIQMQRSQMNKKNIVISKEEGELRFDYENFHSWKNDSIKILTLKEEFETSQNFTVQNYDYIQFDFPYNLKIVVTFEQTCLLPLFFTSNSIQPIVLNSYDELDSINFTQLGQEILQDISIGENLLLNDLSSFDNKNFLKGSIQNEEQNNIGIIYCVYRDFQQNDFEFSLTLSKIPKEQKESLGDQDVFDNDGQSYSLETYESIIFTFENLSKSTDIEIDTFDLNQITIQIDDGTSSLKQDVFSLQEDGIFSQTISTDSVKITVKNISLETIQFSIEIKTYVPQSGGQNTVTPNDEDDTDNTTDTQESQDSILHSVYMIIVYCLLPITAFVIIFVIFYCCYYKTKKKEHDQKYKKQNQKNTSSENLTLSIMIQRQIQEQLQKNQHVIPISPINDLQGYKGIGEQKSNNLQSELSQIPEENSNLTSQYNTQYQTRLNANLEEISTLENAKNLNKSRSTLQIFQVDYKEPQQEYSNLHQKVNQDNYLYKSNDSFDEVFNINDVYVSYPNVESQRSQDKKQ